MKTNKRKCNPYDYLSASARVRMLGNKITTRAKLLQMIHAHDLRQAFQILNTEDIGVGVDPEDYELALVHELEKTYEVVSEITNGLELFNIFRYKYDGLNIKFVLKSKTTDSIPLHLMTTLGTVRKEDIVKGINNIISIPGLPFEIMTAVVEAKEVLAAKQDPQKADVIIDKAVLAAMYRIAHEYDNAFFQKVIRSRIDIENIKSLIRARHAHKDPDAFKSMLNTGGYIETSKFLSIYSANTREVVTFLRNTRYGYALESGLGDLDIDTRLTLFEKVCDNFLLTFISEANRVVFGIEPILGYIMEKENEVTSIRIVMAAKMSGCSERTVIERLREHVW